MRLEQFPFESLITLGAETSTFFLKYKIGNSKTTEKLAKEEIEIKKKRRP